MIANRLCDAEVRSEVAQRPAPQGLVEQLWVLDTGFGKQVLAREVDYHSGLRCSYPILGGALPRGGSNVSVTRLSSLDKMHCSVNLERPLGARALFPISGLFGQASAVAHRAEEDLEVKDYPDCYRRNTPLAEFSFAGSAFQVACAIRYLHLVSEAREREGELVLPSRGSILAACEVSQATKGAGFTLLQLALKPGFELPELTVSPRMVVRASDFRAEKLVELRKQCQAQGDPFAASGVATLDRHLLHLIDPLASGEEQSRAPSAYPAHVLARVLWDEVRTFAFRFRHADDATLCAFLIDRAISPIVRLAEKIGSPLSTASLPRQHR